MKTEYTMVNQALLGTLCILTINKQAIRHHIAFYSDAWVTKSLWLNHYLPLWPWLAGICPYADGSRRARCSTLWERWWTRSAGCDKAAYRPDCSPAYISSVKSTAVSAPAEICRVRPYHHPNGSPARERQSVFNKQISIYF